MEKIRREGLARHWVHAQEEDTAAQMIFRPAGFRLPRARGRESFELLPDGRLVEHGIGPTDKRQITEGRWEFAGDDRLILRRAGAAPRALRVLSAEADRLVIAKPSAGE